MKNIGWLATIPTYSNDINIYSLCEKIWLWKPIFQFETFKIIKKISITIRDLMTIEYHALRLLLMLKFDKQHVV